MQIVTCLAGSCLSFSADSMAFFGATSLFFWVVGLEVIKQVCCITRAWKRLLANSTNNLFLAYNSAIFIDSKPKYFQTLPLPEPSVLRANEELLLVLADSSVAIVLHVVSTSRLALVHSVHALPW